MPVMNTVIVSGGSQPTPTEKYPLFSRVKDDTNTDIGVVAGRFVDGNGQVYAVVCLNNGLVSGALVSESAIVDGLRFYPMTTKYNMTDTATYENQCYIDYCASNGLTTICSAARQLSFTIDGVVYKGQIPNFLEMLMLASNANLLKDENSNLILNLNNGMVCSTYSYYQSTATAGYTPCCQQNGRIQDVSYNASSSSNPKRAYAILEIPIN